MEKTKEVTEKNNMKFFLGIVVGVLILLVIWSLNPYTLIQTKTILQEQKDCKDLGGTLIDNGAYTSIDLQCIQQSRVLKRY